MMPKKKSACKIELKINNKNRQEKFSLIKMRNFIRIT